MFLFDKIKIQSLNLFRAITHHLLFWLSSLLFYLFLTGDQSVFTNYFGLLLRDDVYGNIAFLATLLTIIFSSLDMLFSDKIMRYSPIRIFVILRFVLYFALSILVVFLADNKSIQINDLKNISEIFKQIPALIEKHLRFIVWFNVSCFMSNMLKEGLRKIGKGNYLQWLSGMINKPRNEKRIFMFIDMKSSVTIAEKLQHKKFSYLVQDVFNDLAIVENYGGAIYQYLGDGAIISWDMKKGIRRNNCLKAFFAFQKVIQRNRLFYEMRYGLVPEFKAGLHVGEIMVLQVGGFKRDISYNGDTLNTTARIESMCNEYKQNLLISGILYETLRNQDEFNCQELDRIKLKGKKKQIQIYKVNLKEKKKKVK